MTALAATAPDLVEAVIGFRQWRLGDERLCSLRLDDVWHGGQLDARCHHPEFCDDGEHRAPHGSCSCGVYAYYRPVPPTASLAWPGVVSGAVAMWGELRAHGTGMRAEHAAVVAFALPLDRGAKRRALATLARGLDVDVVTPRHLTRAASAHGSPLPDALKPRGPRVGATGEIR